MPQQHHVDISIVGELKKMLGDEASAAAEFLVLLQKLDNNRGWARLGYASLFDFCHLNLHLTRAEAYSRTRLARLVGEVPRVISFLKSGEVSLSVLRILAPILTPQNFDEVFAFVRGKSTREVEDYRNTFRVHDKPAARGVVRTVYSPITSEAAAERIAWNTTNPAAPIENKVPNSENTRPSNENTLHGNETSPQMNTSDPVPPMQKTVRMSLTLNEKQWEKYRRACNLSNHASTGGDVAEVMEMLLDNFLKKHDAAARQIQVGERHRGCVSASVGQETAAEQKMLMKQKEPFFGNSFEVQRNSLGCRLAILPRSEKIAHKVQEGRYIPKQVRREVRQRDGNRCAFVNADTGQRCECERGLQFDHIMPFALGGESNTSQNLRLLCPAHNRLAAEDVFGRDFMLRKVLAAKSNSTV